MDLKYRGVSYQTSIAGEPAVETQAIGVYRGALYPMKKPGKPALRKHHEEFIYRGICYTR